MKDFEKVFEDWLEKIFESEVPKKVKAFSFNLDESAYEDGYKFGVELIGAEMFDFDDEDWACDEIWEPIQRKIYIPISYSGETWESCLAKIRDLVVKHLSLDNSIAQKLKSGEGVGIGFIDGNLEIIWSRKINI
jgi:uncharacterized membrane-anchored protein YjiN (DUF445 family)